MPKCPACLAAYLAAFTGLGVSAGFAAGFRALVVFVTLAALFLFAARLLRNYQMTKP